MTIIPVKKGVDKTEIFAYNVKVNLKTHSICDIPEKSNIMQGRKGTRSCIIIS